MLLNSSQPVGISPDLLQSSDSGRGGNGGGSGGEDRIFWLFTSVYLVLGILNALHSGYALLLFHRASERDLTRPVRRLLCRLSAFELLFNLMVVCATCLQCVSDSWRRYHPRLDLAWPCAARGASAPALIVGSALRVALTLRNWSVVAIALSRANAVARPLAARAGGLSASTGGADTRAGGGAMRTASTAAAIAASKSRLSGRGTLLLYLLTAGVLPLSAVSELDSVCSLSSMSVTPFATVYYSLLAYVKLKSPLLMYGVNALTQLDSLMNFVIYVCTTRFFRRALLRQWRRIRGRRIPTAGTLAATAAYEWRRGDATPTIRRRAATTGHRSRIVQTSVSLENWHPTMPLLAACGQSPARMQHSSSDL